MILYCLLQNNTACYDSHCAKYLYSPSETNIASFNFILCNMNISVPVKILYVNVAFPDSYCAMSLDCVLRNNIAS